MTRFDIITILTTKYPAVKGDTALVGLAIITQYIDVSERQILYAGDDMVYSLFINEIEELNLLEADLIKLSKLGWGYDSNEQRLSINV